MALMLPRADARTASELAAPRGPLGGPVPGREDRECATRPPTSIPDRDAGPVGADPADRCRPGTARRGLRGGRHRRLDRPADPRGRLGVHTLAASASDRGFAVANRVAAPVVAGAAAIGLVTTLIVLLLPVDALTAVVVGVLGLRRHARPAVRGGGHGRTRRTISPAPGAQAGSSGWVELFRRAAGRHSRRGPVRSRVRRLPHRPAVRRAAPARAPRTAGLPPWRRPRCRRRPSPSTDPARPTPRLRGHRSEAPPVIWAPL